MPTIPHKQPLWRALLILGRVSNLPTVWSNCLAGWLLAGGGYGDQFLLLCVGATCLYAGGMFLNDAFDVDFDRQRRPERPIPSGAIPIRVVWQWGLGLLLAGLLLLSLHGLTTAFLAALLAFTILLYDAIHKIFAFSPVLMAGCRLLLVLLAASTGFDGITGLSIWSALVLSLYVLGLSFLARHESRPARLVYWPCIFLAAPIVLSMIVNRGPYELRGLVLSCLLVIWLLTSLRFIYWWPQPQIGRSVASLLAGIVLVDLLAAGVDLPSCLMFGVLFALSLAFQKFVPAT